MRFTITDKFGRYDAAIRPQVLLTWDDWNDYSYYTLFGIFYIDESAVKHELGGVRIGHREQRTGERVFAIGDTFEKVPENYFSLGADFRYYEALNKLGSQIRNEILISLNDIAKLPEEYEKAVLEQVTYASLLRGKTETEVLRQFRRMANGGSWLTKYRFGYISPNLFNSNSKYELSFIVDPESIVPTNINVLIGRNASGKTSIFNSMIQCLLFQKIDDLDYGSFITNDAAVGEKIFSNLISISYSAFDIAGLERSTSEKPFQIPYTYIGLKKFLDDNSEIIAIKSHLELAEEFKESIGICRRNLKSDTWRRSLEILETDPNFRNEAFYSLMEIEDVDEMVNLAGTKFLRLSSGHKIILLIITRLIETLEEKSLVLIDEPETHLHPPLLSSFIRTLSDLMTLKNGVCIVATHSPVVLQEVPNKCVWKLRRSGAELFSDRLRIETFGENVGVLTNDVFGLEVTNSGFHQLLKEIVANSDSYDEALDKLEQQIGLEAKGILRSMFFKKNRSNESSI